jgi:protein gp37
MPVVYTSASFNYQLGCTPCLSGCANCYAARQASTRLAHVPDYQGLTTKGGKWTGMLRVRGDKKWFEPIRARKPRVYFVNSTSDTFHEERDPGWVERAWATMILSPHHTFLIPTKRPGEARDQLTSKGFYMRVLEWAKEIRAAMPKSHACHGIGISDPRIRPPRNVWIGATASNQAELEAQLEAMVDVPSAMKWLSLEPLLSEVDLIQATEPFRVADVPPFDFVVCGGESGPRARPFDLEWARSVRDACRRLKLPYYCKQFGANASVGGIPFPTKHRKGEDPDEWPVDLRIRQIPLFAQIAHSGSRKLVYRDELA